MGFNTVKLIIKGEGLEGGSGAIHVVKSLGRRGKLYHVYGAHPPRIVQVPIPVAQLMT